MVGDVIHPLNTVFFGPGVYEAVAKMSPVFRLNSFGSAMSPQDLFSMPRMVFRAVAWGTG